MQGAQLNRTLLLLAILCNEFKFCFQALAILLFDINFIEQLEQMHFIEHTLLKV